jgi:glucose uptake protein
MFIGASYAIADNAFWGDLGLGAYAGLLLFAVGMLISTVLFGLFFLNMAIDGGRLSFGAYLGGTFRQHAWGLIGGVVWTAGMAGWLLAQSAPAGEQPAYRLLLFALEGSAVVALLWGLLVWREFQEKNGGSKRMIAVTAVLYIAGLSALAFRFR